VPISNFTLMRATAVFTSIGLVILLAMVVLSFWMMDRTRASTQDVLATRELRSSLVDLLSVVQDAETGQRGYLLTGENRYLEPYQKALQNVEPSIKRLGTALERSGQGGALLSRLRPVIDAKLAELDETVALRRAGKADQALAIVLTDRGKNDMDSLRRLLREETIGSNSCSWKASKPNARTPTPYVG
jgi:CHASE3 domain sensor protein